MFLYLPVVVTVLIICLIITVISAFAWWKTNHGVVQSQITEGGNEVRAGYAADVVAADEMEALLTEYAREILIDDYLATERTCMTKLVTELAKYNVKRLAEEAAAKSLRRKVNVLSARTTNVIEEKTKTDGVLAFLGVSGVKTEDYVNAYVVNYHKALDNMGVDSMAKAAADKVAWDFIRKRFGDKSAYVTAYVLGANETGGEGREGQVALINRLFVCNLHPST